MPCAEPVIQQMAAWRPLDPADEPPRERATLREPPDRRLPRRCLAEAGGPGTSPMATAMPARAVSRQARRRRVDLSAKSLYISYLNVRTAIVQECAVP